VIELPRASDRDGDPLGAGLPSHPLRLSRRRPILDEARQRPVLLDAAMGTRLIEAGLDLRSDDPALWCLSHPEAVAAIHHRDQASGALALLTNTFGANRCRLARLGRAGLLEEINARAVQLARHAAGPQRFVLGSVGPAVALEKGAAAEQAAVLVNEGVDGLLLETFRFPEVEPILEEVIAAIAGSVPVFVSLWQWPDPPETAARRLTLAGAAVLGLNCQPGASAAVAWADRLSGTAGVPLLVKPGVGLRPEEAMSPADLAAVVPMLLDRNVRFIGGCCGTSEEHLRAVAATALFHRVSLGNLSGDKGR
jgi:methionine synthase I (cobalamin-dependent)